MSMTSSLSQTVVAAYTAAVIGICALSLVEGVEAAFIAFVSAVVLASLYFNMKRTRAVPALAWNLLAALVLAFFIVDFLAISESLILSGARFLALIMALKLFDLEKNRDFLLVFVLVFFEILAGAASTTSIAFMAILSVFTAAVIWSLALFTVRGDLNAEGKTGGEVPPGTFGLSFFVSVPILTLASLAITAGVFVIMPRLGIGFLERRSPDAHKVSGFSERVDMGAIGPVKNDSTIIMRVELPGGQPRERLYFRGAVLERYDGRGWARGARTGVSLTRRDNGGFFRVGRTAGGLIEQNILLEPVDTGVVFAASFPAMIEAPFQSLWVEDSSTVRLPVPLYSRVSYKAWSSMSPQPAETGAGAYAHDPYLDSSAEGDKIRGLSDSVAGGAESGMKKAMAVERYLRENYRYTLDPKGGTGAPLEDFLLRTREGYCEHFASAMVMLLRASGVPARLITGFTQGEWNGLGNYFIVRQSDAHSWVEALIDGKWQTFDPTPPSPDAFRSPPVFMLYLDLMRLKWNRYVVHFTLADQRKIAKRAESTGAGIKKAVLAAVETLKDAGWQSLALAGAAATGAALSYILLGAKRRKRSWRATSWHYEELARLLRKRGLERGHGETPLEFAKRTGNKGVLELTEIFNSERYGGKRLGDKEIERAGAILKAIKAEHK